MADEEDTESRIPDPRADWDERAYALHTHGVPSKRSKIVALVAEGYTHSEIAEYLELGSRGEVSTHVKRYRENDLQNARWLAEHAPEI